MPSLRRLKKAAESAYKKWKKSKAKTKKAADALAELQHQEQIAQTNWMLARGAYEAEAGPDDSDLGSTHETSDE